MPLPSVGQLWRDLQKKLDESDINPAPREGKMILAHALGCQIEDLLLCEDAFVTNDVYRQTQSLLKRRQTKEPLGYVLGRAPFWKQDWIVRSGVLIPRPDSEILIAEVLKEREKNLSILEVGTGSGALLASILQERPTWYGTGLENNPIARACSEENLSSYIPRTRFNLLDSIDDLEQTPLSFSIIFTNPPYISEEEFENLDECVKDHEPKSALTGEKDNPTGLTYYTDWIPRLKNMLVPHGLLAMEIGHTQAAEVQNLFLLNGFSQIVIIEDIAGRPRVVKGYNIR